MHVCFYQRRSLLGLALLATIALSQQRFAASAVEVQAHERLFERRDYLAAAPLPLFDDTPSPGPQDVDDPLWAKAGVDLEINAREPDFDHTTKSHGTVSPTPIVGTPRHKTTQRRKKTTKKHRPLKTAANRTTTHALFTPTSTPNTPPTTPSPNPTNPTGNPSSTSLQTVTDHPPTATSTLEPAPREPPTATTEPASVTTQPPEPTSEPPTTTERPIGEPPTTDPTTTDPTTTDPTTTDPTNPTDPTTTEPPTTDPTTTEPTSGEPTTGNPTTAVPSPGEKSPVVAPGRNTTMTAGPYEPSPATGGPVTTRPASDTATAAPTSTHISTTTPVPTTTTQPPVNSPSPTTTTIVRTTTTTTTTPWLPSTIEPLTPTETARPTPQPTNSVPQVVIPNLNPVIPPNSFTVQLRFEHVSYYQVTINGVLAAQIVSFVPAQLAKVLGVDANRILVLSIRNGSGLGSGGPTNRRVRRRRELAAIERRADLITSKDADDAILVSVAIPVDQYDVLAGLVRNQKSILHQPAADSFGQFIDPNYPLSKSPPSSNNGNNNNGGGNQDGNNGNRNNKNGNNKDGDSDGDGVPDFSRDPMTGGNGSRVPGSKDDSAPSTGPLIGGLVGAATIAYVGFAFLVIRKVRTRRLRKQEEEEARKRQISAPVRFVTESHQGWGWHTRD